MAAIDKPNVTITTKKHVTQIWGDGKIYSTHKTIPDNIKLLRDFIFDNKIL